MGALLGSAGEGFAALGETRYYMDILAGMISELARKWETRRYAVFMGVYRFLHI